MYGNLHAIAEMIMIPRQQFYYMPHALLYLTPLLSPLWRLAERDASLKQNVTDPNKHLLTLSVPWVMLLMSMERTWSLQPTYILSWSSSMCRIL